MAPHDQKRFIFSLSLVLLWWAKCRAQEPVAVPYGSLGTCNSTEFFRTGDLSCVECAENQLPTEDGELTAPRETLFICLKFLLLW